MAESGSKEPPELIANALGATFGELLVEQHGFVWETLTDVYGTECVASDPNLDDFLCFPRASVEKRIETGTNEFFNDLLVGLLDARREVLREAGESD